MVRRALGVPPADRDGPRVTVPGRQPIDPAGPPAGGAEDATPATADAILRAIASAAEQEAVQVLHDADAEAQAVIEAAHQLVRERIATACDAAEAVARQETVRKINAARLQLVHRRAEVAAEAVDAAFALAATRLELLASGEAPARWSAALERLARESVALTGQGAVLDVRVADAPVLSALAPTLGASVRPLRDRDVPAGLVARSADGRIEVDATLPTRLARARATLTGQLVRSLGLEE